MDFNELRDFCQEHRLTLSFHAEWGLPNDIWYSIRIERDVRNGWATTREGDELGKIIDAVVAGAKRFIAQEGGDG